MKKSNILLATSTVALLATGCVKPAQDNQPIYETSQPAYGTQQSTGYEETQSSVYQPSAGAVYEEPTTATPTTTYPDTYGTATTQTTTYPDTYGTSTTSTTTYPDTYGTATTQTTTYPDTYGTSTTSTTTYPDTYGSTTTPTTTYPDPYVNGGVSSGTYSSQVATNYPATTSTPVVQSGGIQLQIAALKDYSSAEDYKNRLSLAPGLSAYVQRGAMNKVIVTGIPSMAEANRLKESRFPGAFIVSGGTSGGYTPPVQPNYSTTYSVNNPYGTSSSTSTYATSGNSGVGVQIGAFGSRSKAQSVADAQSGRYPATVKKIGRLYKVILTGFSSRSAAKSYAGRIGGFVVSTY